MGDGTMAPHLALVLGGASSGKSAFAENLATNLGRRRIYLATAQAFDAEMEAKISEHQRMRGDNWQTIETPHTLPETLVNLPPDHAVLIDCATMWLTNRLLGDHPVEDEFPTLIAALGQCASPVVVVSNEVGQGIVPDNALSRRFRNLQGQLNREIAEQADLVVAVMAGLPLALKGTIPGGSAW